MNGRKFVKKRGANSWTMLTASLRPTGCSWKSLWSTIPAVCPVRNYCVQPLMFWGDIRALKRLLDCVPLRQPEYVRIILDRLQAPDETTDQAVLELLDSMGVPSLWVQDYLKAFMTAPVPELRYSLLKGYSLFLRTMLSVKRGRDTWSPFHEFWCVATTAGIRPDSGLGSISPGSSWLRGRKH
jgi:hypothetical protein